jgi:hypothetical protein
MKWGEKLHPNMKLSEKLMSERLQRKIPSKHKRTKEKR